MSWKTAAAAKAGVGALDKISPSAREARIPVQSNFRKVTEFINGIAHASVKGLFDFQCHRVNPGSWVPQVANSSTSQQSLYESGGVANSYRPGRRCHVSF